MYPIRTQRHFNVVTTSSQRYGCCLDVERTLCAYMVWLDGLKISTATNTGFDPSKAIYISSLTKPFAVCRVTLGRIVTTYALKFTSIRNWDWYIIDSKIVSLTLTLELRVLYHPIKDKAIQWKRMNYYYLQSCKSQTPVGRRVGRLGHYYSRILVRLPPLQGHALN